MGQAGLSGCYYPSGLIIKLSCRLLRSCRFNHAWPMHCRMPCSHDCKITQPACHICKSSVGASKVSHRGMLNHMMSVRRWKYLLVGPTACSGLHPGLECTLGVSTSPGCSSSTGSTYCLCCLSLSIHQPIITLSQPHVTVTVHAEQGLACASLRVQRRSLIA